MGKRRRAAILPTNIILLQNVVRRDPESYYEEFLQQHSHYESLRDIFLLNPSSTDNSTEFNDLIGFMSAVCTCYPKETANFPNDLKEILTNNHRDISPELREKIISSLVMLRNKDVVSAEFLIQAIFPLLSAYNTGAATNGLHVKQLRHQIFTTLITLLKSVNTGAKNQKLNKSTQALLFNLLDQKNEHGIYAYKIAKALWIKGIWVDSKTVEIMVQTTLHPDPKISAAGARFFLTGDKEREEAMDSDDEDGFDMNALKHKLSINKKSSKRAKALEKATKVQKKKNNAGKNNQTLLNFSAIQLLNNPQGFAEKLFDKLNNKNSRFDLDSKILFMNLVSRLIGTHKLIILGIYSFFLKYLTPKQHNVTQIMAASAQATHDLVPPDLISTMVRKLADEFVSDGVAAEVAAAGINTIREILARAPLAIETPLLHDLTAYKGSKSKPVSIAAKSLVTLYREVAPEMLIRKDRGKAASMELSAGIKGDALKFGIESSTVTNIPGIELLAKWRKEQGLQNNDEGDEAAWEVAEVSEDESETEGDWVTVESDKEYNISDDEDDKIEEQKKDDEDSDLELSGDEDEAKTDKDVEMKEAPMDPQQAMNELLSSRILTPADFAKLEELKLEAGVNKLLGKTQRNEDEVDTKTLTGPMKYKQLKEERMAQIKEGREDREKFGSRRGKRDAPHSTTNREKARKKNFVMMIHKRQVQGKAKLSLRDKQKVLQAHITKQKKKGH